MESFKYPRMTDASTVGHSIVDASSPSSPRSAEIVDASRAQHSATGNLPTGLAGHHYPPLAPAGFRLNPPGGGIRGGAMHL